MSPRFSTVSRRIWGDAKFQALSAPPPNGQTLWFRLLTGPELTVIPGLFSVGEAALAEALGWDLKGFREAFREVSEQGLAKADWRARIVWVPNAIKHNAPQSPNVVKGWRSGFDELPDSPLKTEALQALKAYVDTMGEGFRKAFREAFGQVSPNQEQEQEQEQEPDVDARAPARPASPAPARPSTTTTTTIGSDQARAVLGELTKHPKLKVVATAETANAIAGMVISGLRIDDVIESIRAVAFDLVEDANEVTVRKALRSYLAKAPSYGEARRAGRATGPPRMAAALRASYDDAQRLEYERREADENARLRAELEARRTAAQAAGIDDSF